MEETTKTPSVAEAKTAAPWGHVKRRVMRLFWMTVSLPVVIPAIVFLLIGEKFAFPYYHKIMENEGVRTWWTNPNKFFGRPS